MSLARIRINLSSEPFRRDRHLFALSVAASIVLALLLVGQGVSILRQRELARESRDRMARLEAQLRAANAEYSRLESTLRQAENAAVFDRGVFLNSLLLRKGVSWTRLFEDLEKVFPGTVRLVAVRPYVADTGLIQLDMVVGAQTPEPVIDLLRRLESSTVFGATALLSSQPPSQNEPLYRYRVSVAYAQKL
jgi:Tfp pilus assembly protein PilN